MSSINTNPAKATLFGSSFNIGMVIYVVVAAGIVLGGTYYLNMLNVSGMYLTLYFAVSLYICFMYGMRWFGADNTLFANPSGTWPPVINTCPDYLTYYERTVNGKKEPACIDRIGVSKNGGIAVFPSSGVAPTDDKYYFSLKADSTDSDKKNSQLCQRAIAAGLTWEGITNGESCVQPDGSTVAPSSGGSGQCP